VPLLPGRAWEVRKDRVWQREVTSCEKYADGEGGEERRGISMGPAPTTINPQPSPAHMGSSPTPTRRLTHPPAPHPPLCPSPLHTGLIPALLRSCSNTRKVTIVCGPSLSHCAVNPL
jgi:hypothetical protein